MSHLVPGACLDLSAWMEGAFGTISIRAVRLLVGRTCRAENISSQNQAGVMALSHMSSSSQDADTAQVKEAIKGRTTTSGN
jgi:hypothetical protein